MPPRQEEHQIAAADLERKIADLADSIAMNPNDGDAYRARGLLYGRKQDYERAINDFDKALSLNPNDARAYGFRGLVWQRKSENKRAIADFDKAIELDPANASVYQIHRERSLNEANATQPSSNVNTSAHAGNRFNLLLNPFVLLSVAPNAATQVIKQAYEDALEDGIAPADDLQRAQQLLLTPRLRVDAEIGGFLDVAPDLAKQIITLLKKGAAYNELKDALNSLHALPRSNVLAHLGSASPMGVAELLQLLETQATIAIGSVHDAVNEVREEAGSGKADRDTITDALVRLEERQTRAVLDTFVGGAAFAATFTTFVERVLADGDASLITKLDTYIRAYSQAASPELSRRREMVVAACDAVRKDPKNRDAVDQITIALHHWNEIEQPLQLFEAHMNREEPHGRDLYFHVRDLCLWLANEKAEYETAKRITQACADVFSNLPRSLGQMQEESEQLTQLRNQQTAVTLLTPLSKVCEEAQQNHRGLEREVLRNGFCSSSLGIAKILFDEFANGVAITSATDVADLPWRLVRDIAISLNNDSKSPSAAAAVINGLVDYFSIRRPSKEMAETLEKDRQTAKKNVAQGEFDKSLAAGRLGSAATLVDYLLTLETDANEVATLHQVRDAIAAKRRSNKNKLWGWGAAAAFVLFLIATNQDNRPSSNQDNRPYSNQNNRPSSPPISRGNSPIQPSIPGPTPAPATATTTDPPAIGTGLSFSQANLRYCAFQKVRLETAQSSASSESARLAISALIDDWNSRCSDYRYLPSDKSVVDAEVISRRSTLEAGGRALADTWATAPTFSKSRLTIDTQGGQRRFTVEMATTPQQWTWGTSFRSSMPADGGMLYVYPKPRISSNTMKTAYFSLDVLFIDQNEKITEIYERRTPLSGEVIRSKGPVKAMLELNGGTTGRLGIKVGDMVHTFPVNDTTSNAR